MNKVTQSGVINVTVDNILEQIKINGNAIPLNGALNEWNQVKKIPANLKPGTLVEIQGRNSDGNGNGTNAGIIASITYPDENGNMKTISTGGAWKCNDTPAYIIAKNAESSIWNGAYGGALPNIEPNAYWIWAPKNWATVATCSITLPLQNLKGTISATVDNILEEVIVDGESIAIPDKASDWSTTKTMKADIKPGSTITIRGKNLNGELGNGQNAGIIATVTYPDADNNILKVSTGSTWICNGKPATIISVNNGNNVWKNVLGRPMSNIDDSASWIWAPSGTSDVATCITTLPNLYTGVIYYTADDRVDEIKIDDKVLPITGYLSEPLKVKTFYANIKPGNVISIKATDQGSFAGILATMFYIDNRGDRVQINTSGNWVCDGKRAVNAGSNTNVPLIDPSAQWIWNSLGNKITTCTFTIPTYPNCA